MNEGRIGLSCSKIKNPSTGNYDVIIVGGFNTTFNGAFYSTLILDMETLEWRYGPELPIKLYGAQMVEHYKGGVVLIGGIDDQFFIQKRLYHLQNLDRPWHRMTQKLNSS